MQSEKRLTERITRILTLIPYVQEHPGVGVEKLAKFARCSPKEILRDLDRVLMCGVPPYYPHDYISVYVEGGRVNLSFAGHFKRPVRLTLQEALALKLMLSVVEKGVPGRSVVEKIDAALSMGTRKRVQEIGERIQILGPYHSLAARLGAIEGAIARRNEIEIEYYTASRDEMTQRTVRPYALVEHQSDWYMVAYCNLRRRELPFRVDRIKTIRQLPTTYAIPEKFNVDKYAQSEIYLPRRREQEVVVRFSPEIARWIREYAPAESVSDTRGGGVLFRIKTNHPQWVLRWVLQFGERAEIIRPRRLRREMVDLCEQMLQNYHKKAGG